MTDSTSPKRNDQLTCYKCGELATALYEGITIPPDSGVVRRATCEEHEYEDMTPIRRPVHGF